MDHNTRHDPQSTTQRRQELINKYGLVKGWRYSIFGEPAPRATERETSLPWYAQAILYAASAATLLVFASSDIVALQHANVFRVTIITLMIGLLLTLVYAMDKSANRTIPRIFILLQRRQYPMFIEHLLYVAGVAIIEMTTLYVVVVHENDIDSILNGHPLISPQSIWFSILAGARVTLAIWTWVHSHFVNEPIPVQWSTIQREATELIGGKALEKVQRLDLNHVGLGALVDGLVLFFQPVARAARTYRFGDDRRMRQAAIDLAHRKEVVATLERLDAPPTLQTIVVPDVPAIATLGARNDESAPPSTAGNTVLKGTTPGTGNVALNIIPFGPDDSRLKGYVLPPNVALDDLMPLSRLAQALGAPQTTLYEAMIASAFTPEPPFGHQPGNTQNYYVWQVLSLVEDGLLEMPKGVRKGHDLASIGVPLSESLSA